MDSTRSRRRAGSGIGSYPKAPTVRTSRFLSRSDSRSRPRTGRAGCPDAPEQQEYRRRVTEYELDR